MNGARAADWPEIDPFGRAMGGLEPWELELLRDMSVAYADEMIKAENPLSKPPTERGQ